jgi:hypothetical protein
MSSMSGPASLESLASRLERIERENRGWRIGGILAAGVAVAALLMGATQNSRTGPLTIEGTGGKSIRIDGDKLVFYDGSGKARLWEGYDSGQPYVDLNDSTGKNRISMYLAPSGLGVFRISNGSGHRLIRLEETTERVGQLLLNGSDENERAVIVGSDKPFFRVTDGAGQARAFFGLYTDQTAGAFLKNGSGKTTWSAP